MKCTIERAALLRSLRHVQGVVERKTTIPIIGNVKLTAGDGLELVATDFDLTLRVREDATVESPGSTTVHAHTLFDIVRKLPDGVLVRLAQAPGAAEIELVAGRSRFVLPTLPVDDFPVAGAEEPQVRFALEPTALAKIIDKARFAISTEETRYFLNGLHLHASGDAATRKLRGVATDGHRLAMVETGPPAAAAAMPPVIVPRKTVGELRKLLDSASGEVTVGISNGWIEFVCGRATLHSRLIDGTFPDYERVIPADHERVAVVAARSFGESVDRVATIAIDKARPVKLAFDEGRLTVSVTTTEHGRAVEELDCEYHGEPFEIGFNARYVLDVVAQVDGPEMRIEMTNAASPAIVRDLADAAVLFVLMPMRL